MPKFSRLGITISIAVAYAFGSSGAELSAAPQSKYPAGFKAIEMKGATKCTKPNQKIMTDYGEFGAVGICYSYKMKRNADIFSNITNAVWDVFTVGGFFGAVPVDGAMLWTPSKGKVRFEVKRSGERYRLCKYWRHHVSNIPPPGKYTGHGFINKKKDSIDYWMKVKQRGYGKNSRIGGVVETLFVPDSLHAQALAAGFCTV